jgi:hypothetical protein
MTDALVDPHLLLIGRPPLAEYLGFVTTQTLQGETADPAALATEWRSANDRVRELETLEAGIANAASIVSIDAGLEELRRKVLADPAYRRAFSIVPARIGVVELDTLVVFQKHVNLAYVDHLHRKFGDRPSSEDLFRFCLPLRHPAPAPTQSRVAQNAFVFVSPSTDFRLLDVRLFAPSDLPGYTTAGPVTSVVGLVVGYGSNYFNVLRCEDRLVLNNGSHRAYALRKAGITHVPCVIQEISRREELELIAGGDVAAHPDRYFEATRPPLFKDFFDSYLRKIVNARRQLRQMKITFSVEMLEVPASESAASVTEPEQE